MPSATMSSDTGTVPTRVTSSRFIGRSRELAELEAALADASAGRPSLAFIAGESGVGKTRLLQELERGALAAEARVVSGECVSLGEDELPYAPIVAALRSLTRDGDPVLDELGPATRAGLASLLPELAPATAPAGHGPRRAGAVARLRGAADAARPARPPGARPAGDRGPALGRRLDARLPLLPRAQPALRARAARRLLPPRRAAPPPPAAPAAGRARARAARAAHRARAPHALRAGRAARGHPRRRARRRARRAHVRAQRGQPALHRGAAGRRPRRARRAAPDAARRAHGPHRGAPAGRPGGAARASPPVAAWTTRCWPRPRASSPARCARPCARRRPAT